MALQQPDEESHPRYEGWRVAWASAVGVYFASLVVVTFPVLLKPWSAEFSWSREEVSRAFGIGAMVAGISAAPLGYILDRVSPRKVVVPSLVVLGCAFASLSLLTPHLGHLYAAFAVLGMAAIGTSPVAYARTIATWFHARRGLGLALVITGGSLGGILHPPAAEALIQQVGWRGACLWLGISVLAVGVPVALRFVRERPSAAMSDRKSEGASIRQGLGSRAFWMLAAVMVCGIMLQNGVIVHLSALLTDRGVSPGLAAIALSVMAGAALAGRLVTGYWIDRVFAARVLVVLMVLSAGGAFLLSNARSYGLGVLAAMLVGFGIGGESDVVPYLLSRYFGLRSFSTLYGFAWLANAIGGATGPVLMGRAFDTVGSYEPILVQMSAAVLGAAVLVLLLPRYQGRAAA